MHATRTILILFVFSLLGCARPAERAPSCPPAVAAAPGPAASPPATPAPASTRLVSLDLPKAGEVSDFAPPAVPDPRWTGEQHAILKVTISKDETTYVDGQEISGMAELSKRAEAARATDPEVRVVIMADRDAAWGKVVLTLDALKRSGITRIAFAIEAESPKP